MFISVACKSYNSRDIRPLWQVIYPRLACKHLSVNISPYFSDIVSPYEISPFGGQLSSPSAKLSVYINKITNSQEVLLGGLLRQCWLSGYCCPGVLGLNDCGPTSRADKVSRQVKADVRTVV